MSSPMIRALPGASLWPAGALGEEEATSAAGVAEVVMCVAFCRV
jgi:hypothetical protein